MANPRIILAFMAHTDQPKVITVGHYVQPAGTQPSGMQTPVGGGLVELVTGGRGWVDDPELGWVEVTRGDQLWHEAGEWTIRRSDERDPYRCLVVWFQRDVARPRPLPRRTRWSDPGAVRAFAQEAQSWFREPAISDEVRSQAILGRVVLEGQRWLGRQAGQELPAAVLKVRDHLDLTFAGTTSLDALAEVASCSPQHLHHLFRTHLGTSPHQWLIARRIREVKEMLAGSEQGLEAIARASGFPDAATLCRAFRRATGVSPGAWRRRPW